MSHTRPGRWGQEDLVGIARVRGLPDRHDSADKGGFLSPSSPTDIQGYVVRWATYSLGDFEEGVSLTCDDELNRWQKYSFGCS